MIIRLVLASFLLTLSLSGVGQLSLTSIGGNHVITFDASVPGVSNGVFSGSGFAPSPAVGQLDSDAWKIYNISTYSGGPQIVSNYGDTNTGGDFALGSSNVPVTTGGIYSFYGLPGSTSNRAMGFQPSGNAFSGANGSSVELRCVNNTGQTITEIYLNYRIYIRNDQSKSSKLSVSISQDFFPGYTNLTKFDIPSLDTFSPDVAGGTGWSSLSPSSFTISGLCVRPGEYFYVNWTITDALGSGSRDEFALDNINIRPTQGVAEPTFYTQGSGDQLQTAGGSLLWSTLPVGNVKFPMSPFIPTADYVVQNGHTMTHKGSGPQMTLDDLTVESGASLISDQLGSGTFIRYLNLRGNLLCNGSIGNASGAGAGLAFDFEAGDHLVSGTGSINASRMRKIDNPLLLGICNLDFQMNVRLHFPGNALLNERIALDAGTNIFNVKISTGTTVTIDSNAGIDGANPAANNGNNGGGSFDIYGTLTVGKIFYMRTDNSSIGVSTTLRSGGRLNAGETYNSGSGSAGHNLVMESGSILDFKGNNSVNTWTNFSVVNNTYTLNPNSTVIYSRNNTQYILIDLDYRNLILNGTGGSGDRQTWSPSGTGVLTIRENLNITGNAHLIPGAINVLINGAWTSYGQLGLSEGSGLVIFENLTPGASTINTVGGEEFYRLEIRSGAVTMNCDVDVINDLDLFARLNLNSRNLLVRNPVLTTLGMASQAMVVSEDVLHQGSMTVTVNSYNGPVDFPFGTAAGQPIYCQFTRNLTSESAGQVTMATYPTGANNLPHPVSPQAVTNLFSIAGLVPDNRDATVDRFWSIQSSGTSVDANVSISFLNSEMPSGAPYNDVSMIRAQRYDVPLNKWQDELPAQTVVQNSPSAGIHRIIIPNVTQFSPWAAASSSSPLPVALLSFTGEAIKDGIKLDWRTASEINNSHFELTRFTASDSERSIGEVDGSGNSSSQISYEFIDPQPLKGWNYYRLTQVDFDGTSSDEGTIAVLWQSESSLSINSYSWRSDGLSLNVQGSTGPVSMKIFDISGRMLYADYIPLGSSIVPFIPQSDGIYIIHLENGVNSISQKALYLNP